MTCYSPYVAFWYKPEFQATRPGNLEKPIFISKFVGLQYDYSVSLHLPPLIKYCLQQYFIPCGKCEGCRVANLQQWKFRAMCELMEHQISAFITLTVDDQYMQDTFPNLELQHRPFQLFMKSLRKRFGSGLRYIMCGEYGTHSLRPHYHVIVFGWFPDDYQLLKHKDKYDVFVSPFLSKIWPRGYHTVSVANEMTVKYLVGYVLKKCNCPFPADSPPYLRVSTRPAIGLDFFNRYKNELFACTGDLQFPNSYVYSGNSKIALPRYFIKKYAECADNVAYVSFQKYRLAKLAESPAQDISDLQRVQDFFRMKNQASHNFREDEV